MIQVWSSRKVLTHLLRFLKPSCSYCSRGGMKISASSSFDIVQDGLKMKLVKKRAASSSG
jgi:hypothetical protein